MSVLASGWDWLGEFGAALFSQFFYLLTLTAGVGVGCAAARHYRRTALGWAFGVATIVLLTALFLPINSAADRIACRHADDFRACVDNDDGD